MAKTCSVAINGRTFKAKAGDLLLDAALSNGVHIPNDCRSGACGSCLTRLVRGSTILGDSATPGVIHACKARILSDLELESDEAPEAVRLRGRLAALLPLAPDVFEMTIEPERRPRFLPGQYFNFKFDGFPARSYSASRPIARRPSTSGLSLQVRRFADGCVSGEFGRGIRAGHGVTIEGPYGSAFFRKGKAGRLVLVSSGTGFAPIWGIACAALRENAEREIAVVCGVRSTDPIYMGPALERLAAFKNVDVIVTIGRRPGVSDLVREGYPTDHLPTLSASDIVYACGARPMIEALTPLVIASGAQYFTDPFEPAAATEENALLEGVKRLKQLLAPQREWRVPQAGAV